MSKNWLKKIWPSINFNVLVRNYIDDEFNFLINIGISSFWNINCRIML